MWPEREEAQRVGELQAGLARKLLRAYASRQPDLRARKPRFAPDPLLLLHVAEDASDQVDRLVLGAKVLVVVAPLLRA